MSFFDRLTDELKDLGTSIGNWVPKIIGALVVIIIGWFIAKWVRRIVRKLLSHDRVTAFFDATGVGPALRNAGYSAANLVSTILYGYLMLLVFLFAAEALEVAAVVDLLRRLIAFLPIVFVAFIIVMIAAAVGRFAANIAAPWAERQNMGWVPSAIRVGFLVFGVLTALDLLAIGFVTNSLLTALLGGVGIAFAIAFGVGGIDTAKLWWAKYLSPRDGGTAPAQHESSSTF